MAANPNTNMASERQQVGLNQQNTSFTIPFPNQTSHKESWFGSFGNYGRKSTDMNAFQGRSSFSLGQEPSSSNNNMNPNNFSMGMNQHKFSLTASFLNSSNINTTKKPSICKNEQLSPNEIKDSSEFDNKSSGEVGDRRP